MRAMSLKVCIPIVLLVLYIVLRVLEVKTSLGALITFWVNKNQGTRVIITELFP